MTPLVYETDVSSSCGPEDADFAAFIEVTSLIDGHDAVEEFLASGLRPIGQQFGFEVEMKESPLSKVIVPMPRITTAIGQRESEATFVAQIEKVVNELVGRYNIVEHNAYQGLRYGRLNHVFELARTLCHPHPEPVGHKRKVKLSDAVTAPVARKDSSKRGCGGKSIRFEM
jgi:hypothetical protein